MTGMEIAAAASAAMCGPCCISNVSEVQAPVPPVHYEDVVVCEVDTVILWLHGILLRL